MLSEALFYLGTVYFVFYISKSKEISGTAVLKLVRDLRVWFCTSLRCAQ